MLFARKGKYTGKVKNTYIIVGGKARRYGKVEKILGKF